MLLAVWRTCVRLKSTTSASYRVGCSSGFWGDSSTAAEQLVTRGHINCLTADYLSEITMSLLAGVKMKKPELGFVPDFVEAALKPCAGEIAAQGIKVVTNAGGVNPLSCAAAARSVTKSTAPNLRIASVTGDNVLPLLAGREFTDLDTGDVVPVKRLVSANAYLGAWPIVACLERGADVVITGRCTDSALMLAPLAHHFGWRPDDFTAAAAGSLVGHLLECGIQTTGGIHTDWNTVQRWEDAGFPIADVQSDGSFLITKPEGTGGLVTPGTVAEQLVYEIGDPTRYQLPDVCCDFSNVLLQQSTADAVSVSGVKGMAPSDQYKVCTTAAVGWRSTAVCLMAGGKAVAKSQKTALAILARCEEFNKRRGLGPFTKTHVQVIGGEEQYGAATERRDVALWLAVQHTSREAVQFFSKEVASAGTGMAPGFTALVGGRPAVSPVLRLYSFALDKSEVEISCDVEGDSFVFEAPSVPTSPPPAPQVLSPIIEPFLQGSHTYPLGELAYTRSGDKGDHCNIGVIARHPDLLPLLRHNLTKKVVFERFRHCFAPGAEPDTSIDVFELPGVSGLNFLLRNSLGGGGVASLRPDPQGKAYAQILADMQILDCPDIAEYQ